MGTGIVVEPVPDCVVFDLDVKPTLSMAKEIVAAGGRGVIRYVGLHGPAPEDIDSGELAMWMDLGVGLMLAQHVLYENWNPSETLGAQHGMVAARLCDACGYELGATLWDDLEGMVKGTTSDAAAGYANAKYEILKSARRSQGEYIGDDVPLSSSDLFVRLKSQIYWRSLSVVPDVAQRGYAIRQLTTVKVAGTEADLNWSTADRLGGRPMWMRAA